ncbi:WXG100 family type VII secretion target [Streptomyces sp. NBC_01310]|uniref:WXG100 family type VII secretion target n=1 Tax=Streptomyces sp. NBC_01310 TaxID=2903820 RepID=UPI0035B6A6AD|nr:WXG100 family type VII secretion target [Streptomyces sp. NBC_01310]
MTDFEGYTHAQLHAMVASLDPGKVEELGTQLTEAAKTIETIGNKLKDHKVKGWEGEAATAFQNWVNQAGSATLVLSKYSADGGKYMTDAAQVMREVKPTADDKGGMPPYNAGEDASRKQALEIAREHRNEPDAIALGQTAWHELNDNHNRAVIALNKLAGAYEQSTLQMNKAEIPTFPPPPAVLVPEVRYDNGEMARSGGGSTAYGGGGSGAGSYTPSGSPGGASSNEPGWVPGHQPRPDNTVPSVSVPSIPDRDVNVDLDSVATLPERTAPPVTTAPGGPLPTGPGGPHPGPVPPPLTFPGVGGGKPPSMVTGPGGIGPFPGPSGPGASGGRFGGMPPGVPPRDSGIMGGRPVTSTGPSAGIPRGTVIGEGAPGGRGVGGGMGPGVGGGHVGQSGFPAGRRLASEPGGVVGGRQSGVAGRPIVAGQPFTQGGSGLVRNGASGAGVGAMGHAGAGAQTPGRRRDDQRGERPDYLAEDEETWQGNRRVVPPVID